MKVFIVYHYFAHYRKAVFEEIIKIADEQGSIIKFVGDHISNEPNLKLYGFDEHCDKFVGVENRWFGKFLWQRSLLKLMLKESPDVVIFLGQFNFISTWVASILLKIINKRVIFWGHGLYGNETGLKKKVRNLFNTIPHVYMTYGERAKTLMIKSGLPENRISVIYNSLDVDSQNIFYDKLTKLNQFENSEYIFDKDKTNLLFVGRLTKIKKIGLILDALTKLDIIDYKLLIIGSGPEEENLKQDVKKLGLNDYVFFTGAIHDEIELSWLIYNSDICVSPGNVGLTAMHSLIYGTPVITSDDFNSQMPEFEAIDVGINGDFFAADDSYSLAKSIERVRANIIAFGRDTIREKCREPICRKYNPKNQAKLIWENINKHVK